MIMTQTEQIVWHKYPEEKPGKDKKYLLHYKHLFTSPFIGDDSVDVREYIDLVYYDGKWGNNEDQDIKDENVIAWAEMPKGWQEEV